MKKLGLLRLFGALAGMMIITSGLYASEKAQPSYGMEPNQEAEISQVVLCAYSQGYWFSKPGVEWPFKVVIGAGKYEFGKQEAKALFWPPNTPTKSAFAQYAAIYLSGTSLEMFPQLKEAMKTIDTYFANVYPASPGHDVEVAAGYIGNWISDHHCDDVVCEMDVNITVTPVSCYGEADGRIFVEMRGAKPFGICIIYDGCEDDVMEITDKSLLEQTPQTATYRNLKAGYYLIEVVDNYGCITWECVYVPEPAELTAQITEQHNPLCPETLTGSAVIHISGGTPPYTASKGVVDGHTLNLTQLGKGTHKVYIDDANSCGPVEVNVVMTDPEAIAVQWDFDPIVCYGGTTMVKVKGSGGTGTLKLYAVVGEDHIYVDDLPTTVEAAAGPINWVVKDDNGCMFLIQDNLDDGYEVDVKLSLGHISCHDGDDGWIKVEVLEGEAPYKICLIQGCPEEPVCPEEKCEDAMFEGLVAGKYNIMVVDANGCEWTECVTLTEPEPVVAAAVYDPILCYGGSTLVNVTASGGTGKLGLYDVVEGKNVFVSWLPLAEPLNLPADAYTWVVMDENHCWVPVNFTLNQPPAILVEIDYDPILCYGDETEVTVTGSGGTGVLKLYAVVNGEHVLVGALPQTVSVGAGSINWVVKDKNGCIFPIIEEIEDGIELVVDYKVQHISCFGAEDGMISIEILGGADPYSICLFPYCTLEAVVCADKAGHHDPDAVFDGLAAGEYMVVVVDKNGCEWRMCITIEEPDPVVAAAVYDPILCFGEKVLVDVEAQGGTGILKLYDKVEDKLVFVSNLPLAEPLLLGAGKYTWVVMDENGCWVPVEFQLTDPDKIEVSWKFDPILCYGGSTEVLVTGKGGTGKLTLYAVGEGPNGQLTQVGELPQTVPVDAGPIHWLVMDENDCVFVIKDLIPQPDELLVDLEVFDASCYGKKDGMITGFITGGVGPYNVCLFTWCKEDDFNGTPGADKSQAFAHTLLEPGEYTVVVTDQNGCIWWKCVTIGAPEPLALELLAENIVCVADNQKAYVSDWVWYRQGKNKLGEPVLEARSNPDKVIGKPSGQNEEGSFFTLGFGGEMIVKFAAPVLNADGKDLQIVETSFGDETCATYPEKVKVWVAQYINEELYKPVQGNLNVPGLGDTWHYLGVYCLDALIELGDLPWIQYVYLKDVSDPDEFTAAADQDGYDIDGLIALHGLVSITADLKAIPSGGTPPYTYLWSTGETTQTITTTGVGPFAVVVKDAKGCTIADYMVIECEAVVIEPSSPLDSRPLITNAQATIRAFPNPLRTEATIEFELMQSGNVSLEIYNVVGERVAVLFEGYVEALTGQQATFQAGSLPNGVYFYRLNTNHGTFINKMMISR